jgi:hypothetical protein
VDADFRFLHGVIVPPWGIHRAVCNTGRCHGLKLRAAWADNDC